MPARRARPGLAHALVWTGWGAAAALVTQQPLPSSTLALGGAVAAACAAVVMLLPMRSPDHRKGIVLLGVAAAAVAICTVRTALVGTLDLVLLVPWLAVAAAWHTRAIASRAAADPGLAPRVRLAPTLLALGVGAGAIAAGVAIGLPAVAMLVAIIVLHVAAMLLLVGPAASTPSLDALPGSASPPARLLPLLGLAVAGATAIVVLRPALSTLGGDGPPSAAAAALTLVLAGLAGPPLARAVGRLGLGRGGALLATLAGAAALVAPVARPGALDLIAAAVLGVALAAAVALAELARRSGVHVPPRAAGVLLLAGALGALIAGLLLTTVPLPDVVLGASIACLIAGLGAWAPAPRERVAPR